MKAARVNSDMCIMVTDLIHADEILELFEKLLRQGVSNVVFTVEGEDEQ